MRRAVVDRRTTETQIALTIALDGKGNYDVRTGIRFLDHMMELFARHGGFDLKIVSLGGQGELRGEEVQKITLHWSARHDTSGILGQAAFGETLQGPPS